MAGELKWLLPPSRILELFLSLILLAALGINADLKSRDLTHNLAGA